MQVYRTAITQIYKFRVRPFLLVFRGCSCIMVTILEKRTSAHIWKRSKIKSAQSVEVIGGCWAVELSFSGV